MPYKYVVLEELPRNRMQKLDRKALRQIWEKQGTADLMNPVMQAILSRHSIRKFTDQDIPAEILDMIFFKSGLSRTKRTQYAVLEIYSSDHAGRHRCLKGGCKGSSCGTEGEFLWLGKPESTDSCLK